MAKVDEGIGVSASPLNAALEAGLESISRLSTITFQRYVKLVLPIDGFVFWVNADLVAISNLPDLPTAPGPADDNSVDVEGSFHYSTDQRQDEDQTIGINRVLFATSDEIQQFNNIAPTTIWIATFDDIRFAFSRRGSFFPEAGIHHYQGDAVYPPLDTQIIDSLADLDESQIVSNSLPIWLSIPAFRAVWWAPLWSWPLYPSFVVPDNVRPPYATIHVIPDQTQAIQAIPWIALDSSDYQLARDLVRITFYGVRNEEARSFLVSVLSYSLNTDNFGIMGSMPIVRDEKRVQSELGLLAQKKTIEFEVSYYQGAARNIARQLIKEAIPTFLIAPFSPPST